MPWLYITICIVGWGFWGFTEKMSVNYISPFMAQLINAYVASAIAPLLFLYMKTSNQTMEWNAKGIAWTIATTILGTISSMSLLAALQKSDAHKIIGITSAYPLVTTLLCIIFLGENVTIAKFAGMLAIIVGTILIGM